jgi:hypothetical protein
VRVDLIEARKKGRNIFVSTLFYVFDNRANIGIGGAFGINDPQRSLAGLDSWIAAS